jgi:FixJ family two-component response regulator
MLDAPIVYVVDDDESIRRALSRLLRSVGLEVQTFPSAQAFLDHRLLDRTACLVLDVRLPGLSGLDLQVALGPRQGTVPIVFISGHGDVPMSVRAMKHGAVDFILKPFHDQDLLDAVHAALRRSREARAERAEREVLERRRATLTPREREVLELVVTGMLNKQIAAALGGAEKTVKVHRARVMIKMQAGSVAELVRMTEKLAAAPIPPGRADGREPPRGTTADEATALPASAGGVR